MKQIILSFLAVFTLQACTKENNSSDQVTSEEAMTEDVSYSEFSFKETSPEELAQILAPQKNDTLYITNFFATWCGPCMREIPHFKEQKEQLKKSPVKFRFVNIDPKEDWTTKVKYFAQKNGLEKDILLVDGQKLNEQFFIENFKVWDGSGIPFTMFRKGTVTKEDFGMMSKNQLKERIEEFKK